MAYNGFAIDNCLDSEKVTKQLDEARQIIPGGVQHNLAFNQGSICHLDNARLCIFV